MTKKTHQVKKRQKTVNFGDPSSETSEKKLHNRTKTCEFEQSNQQV